MFILSFVFALWAMLPGQTTLIDFETDGEGYIPSETGGSGVTDVFNRVNPDIGGNASYIWAMEDYNNNPSLTLDQIYTTGATSFIFSVDFLTPNSNDWDAADELIITYSMNGSAYENLMWVQSVQDATNYNDPAALDLAFDGDGDTGQELPAIVDDYPVGVGGDFVTFSTSDIAITGSTLDIKLQFNGLTSTAEGIFLDNLSIVLDNSIGTYFEADQVSGYPPLTVNFTGLSIGYVTDWAWDFENDGAYDSYEQNPTHVYNYVGSHSVKLQVSDGTNVDSLIQYTYITVTYCPPVPPENVEVNVDYPDANISWTAVDTTECGSPITPDGYVITYSEDEVDYLFLNYTTELSYIHTFVAQFRPQMFYQIISHKDFTRAQLEYLESLNNSREVIKWSDVKWNLDSMRE